MAVPEREQYFYKYYIKYAALGTWFCEYKGNDKKTFNYYLKRLKDAKYDEVVSYQDKAVYLPGTWNTREQRDV